MLTSALMMQRMHQEPYGGFLRIRRTSTRDLTKIDEERGRRIGRNRPLSGLLWR